MGSGGVPFWPGGRGGRPRALIPGKGVARLWVPTPDGGFREAGQGRGGCKGFGSGEVGGRDTGPVTEQMAFFEDALWGGGCTHRSWPGGPWLQERVGGGVRAGKFRNVCRFLSLRRKMFFFEGCPVGLGGGYPPELAWWTGG